jgi:hypothetical protein
MAKDDLCPHPRGKYGIFQKPLDIYPQKVYIYSAQKSKRQQKSPAFLCL